MDAFEKRRIKDAEASKKAMERLSKIIIMGSDYEPCCRRKKRPPQHQDKLNPWFDGI
jgi:hypothetical protein